MSSFPRTNIGGVSLPRLLIGTNWFCGFSHTSKAKDTYIKEHVANRKAVADIVEVFVNAGIDAAMGLMTRPELVEGLEEAEQRTGKAITRISTPGFPRSAETPAKGFDLDACRRLVEAEKAAGSCFLMPHQSTTDAMVDRCTRTHRQMAPLLGLIREYGMIPGLSTHMPESITYADEQELDVETYISIYNAMGFLMQVEVDWTHRIILNARKPVMTIKPMAAGQLRPFQAFQFVWTTLRPQDMVTVGTMSPDEARECIELSLQILEHRQVQIELQETRSKESVKRKEMSR